MGSHSLGWVFGEGKQYYLAPARHAGSGTVPCICVGCTERRGIVPDIVPRWCMVLLPAFAHNPGLTFEIKLSR